jgi:sodium transport system permease protein
MQMFSAGVAYDWRTVALILTLTPPLMALTVTLQIIIAAMTRSFKEALTWLGLLPVLPAGTSFVLVFSPVAGDLRLMFVPVLSQTVLLGQVMRGEQPAALAIVVAGISTLMTSVLLLRFAAGLFDREEIVFGA